MEGFIVNDVVEPLDEVKSDNASYSQPNFETMSRQEESFKIWLQFLVSCQLDPNFLRHDQNTESYDYFNGARRFIEDGILSRRESLVSSSVWSAKLLDVIKTLPSMKSIEKDCGNCTGCNRAAHPAKMEVVFAGYPYPSDTCWTGRVDDVRLLSSDIESEIYQFGRVCHNRIRLYHSIQHYKASIVLRIKKRIEDIEKKHPYAEADNLLDRVLTKTWSDQMYRRYQHLIECAGKFRSTDARRVERLEIPSFMNESLVCLMPSLWEDSEGNSESENEEDKKSEIDESREPAGGVAESREPASEMNKFLKLANEMAESRGPSSEVTKFLELANEMVALRQSASMMSESPESVSMIAKSRKSNRNMIESRESASEVAESLEPASEVAEFREPTSEVAESRGSTGEDVNEMKSDQSESSAQMDALRMNGDVRIEQESGVALSSPPSSPDDSRPKFCIVMFDQMSTAQRMQFLAELSGRLTGEQLRAVVRGSSETACNDVRSAIRFV
eukprot:91428_1